jgi:hypothetical protein
MIGVAFLAFFVLLNLKKKDYDKKTDLFISPNFMG